MWKTLRKFAGGFLAYNTYSFVLMAAFVINSPRLFGSEGSAVENFSPGAAPFSYYVWFLVARCLTTLIPAFLAGAIVKARGGMRAVLFNVLWALFHLISGIAVFAGAVEGWSWKFALVSVIAAPLTTGIAFLGGTWGQHYQAKHCEEETVLDLWPYHWVWAIVPAAVYATGFVRTVGLFIRLAQSSPDLIDALTALLPVIAWTAPLAIAQDVLAGSMLSNKGKIARAVVVIVILAIGVAMALGIEMAWDSMFAVAEQ